MYIVKIKRSEPYASSLRLVMIILTQIAKIVHKKRSEMANSDLDT